MPRLKAGFLVQACISGHRCNLHVKSDIKSTQTNKRAKMRTSGVKQSQIVIFGSHIMISLWEKTKSSLEVFIPDCSESREVLEPPIHSHH